MKYLTKHRNNYYFKRKIPTTQKHIVISLRTDSLTEANYITAIITPKFINLLVEKVNKMMNWDDEIDYIKAIIQEYVNEAKEDYTKYSKAREQRYTYTTKKDDERLGSHPKAIKKAINYLVDNLHSSKKNEIYQNLINDTELENKCDYAITVLSEDNQERLKDEIIKAEIELLTNDYDNNFNRTNNPNTYIKRTQTPLNQTITPFPMPNFTHTEIKQNLGYYKKKKEEILIDFMEKKTEETKEPERYERDIKIFFDLIDKDYLIDISHEDMKHFIKEFFFLPDRNGNRELFKNAKNYKEVIQIAKEKSIESITKKTIRNKLININAFLDYAVEYDYLDKNRLRYKIFISTEDLEDEKNRKEFYPEQLFSLFYKSEWYKEKLEENLKTYPSKIWVPLILLFAGCRLNELCQIYTEQIIEKEGVYFFKIEDEHEDQKLKNRSSRRKIPIHPMLIDLGILKFIEKQKKENKTRLFSELYYTEKKGYGNAFSKLFNDKKFKFSWLDKQAKEKLENEDILLDLHSFRHNFSGSLKGLEEVGLLDYFLGHRQNSLSQSKYGKYRPTLLCEKISQCEYNLDFKPLIKSINSFYDGISK